MSGRLVLLSNQTTELYCLKTTNFAIRASPLKEAVCHELPPDRRAEVIAEVHASIPPTSLIAEPDRLRLFG